MSPKLFTPAQIVVIGTSTGGPDALEAVLAPLPASFPAPIVVVQHLPANFSGGFTRRLDERCAVTVREAQHCNILHPGQVYLAPPDLHVEVRRAGSVAIISLGDSPLVNGCRPAVDPLFASAAAVFEERTLGLVLTGLGTDGMFGARAIRHAGGQVLVQDEATSAVWGMPGAVVRANLANAQVPLDAVATALQVRTRPEPWPAAWNPRAA